MEKKTNNRKSTTNKKVVKKQTTTDAPKKKVVRKKKINVLPEGKGPGIPTPQKNGTPKKPITKAERVKALTGKDINPYVKKKVMSNTIDNTPYAKRTFNNGGFTTTEKGSTPLEINKAMNRTNIPKLKAVSPTQPKGKYEWFGTWVKGAAPLAIGFLGTVAAGLWTTWPAWAVAAPAVAGVVALGIMIALD